VISPYNAERGSNRSSNCSPQFTGSINPKNWLTSRKLDAKKMRRYCHAQCRSSPPRWTRSLISAPNIASTEPCLDTKIEAWTMFLTRKFSYANHYVAHDNPACEESSGQGCRRGRRFAVAAADYWFRHNTRGHICNNSRRSGRSSVRGSLRQKSLRHVTADPERGLPTMIYPKAVASVRTDRRVHADSSFYPRRNQRSAFAHLYLGKRIRRFKWELSSEAAASEERSVAKWAFSLEYDEPAKNDRCVSPTPRRNRLIAAGQARDQNSAIAS